MNEEDRLTYALQAEGPDEFPEAYYRNLAREQLAVDASLATCCGGHAKTGLCYNDPEDVL